MELNTASAIINFAVKLEDDSAKFYEEAAQACPEGEQLFLAFAEENKKHRVTMERAYYEVVSDALETGFSFEGLRADGYSLKAGQAEGRSYSDLLQAALEIEDQIQRFYLDAAERSRSLLADIPRVFERLAKKREERKLKLQELSEISSKDPKS